MLTLRNARFGLVAIALTIAPQVFAEKFEITQLPDEYESVGDQALGFGNAGVASASGTASLRLNPGALATPTPVYSVSGGYHWPREGRDFYQAGIIDSKTSPTAAAFSYTGFLDEYDPEASVIGDQVDSPIVRRASVGFAQILGKVSAGVAGHYVEGAPILDPTAQPIKGWSLGAGVATNLTPAIRLGASVENLANSKIADYAPRTYRAGGAWDLSKDFSISLDYRRRDRVDKLENLIFSDTSLTLAEREEAKDKYLQPEQMVIGSFAARVYDVVRLVGTYGQSATDDGRRLLAGGIAIVNDKISIGYGASREHMRSDVAHQAVNLNMSIAL